MLIYYRITVVPIVAIVADVVDALFTTLIDHLSSVAKFTDVLEVNVPAAALAAIVITMLVSTPFFLSVTTSEPVAGCVPVVITVRYWAVVAYGKDV